MRRVAVLLLVGLVAVACGGEDEEQELSATLQVTGVQKLPLKGFIDSDITVNNVSSLQELNTVLKSGSDVREGVKPQSVSELEDGFTGEAICPQDEREKYELVIKDSADETVGLSRPGPSPKAKLDGIANQGTYDAAVSMGCVLSYEIAELPKSDFYIVEVAGTEATYSYEELEAAGWQLDLQLGNL